MLVIAEHSLGIWGLLLAVPLTVFALDYIIKYPDSSVTEVITLHPGLGTGKLATPDFALAEHRAPSMLPPQIVRAQVGEKELEKVLHSRDEDDGSPTTTPVPAAGQAAAPAAPRPAGGSPSNLRSASPSPTPHSGSLALEPGA